MSHSKEVRPLEDYQEIGHRWKSGNIWSLMILIGRGLDPRRLRKEEKEANEAAGEDKMLDSWMCSFQGMSRIEKESSMCGKSPRGRERL